MKADHSRKHSILLQYTALEHKILRGESVTGNVSLTPQASVMNFSRAKLTRQQSIIQQQQIQAAQAAKESKPVMLLGFQIPNRKATTEIKMRIISNFYQTRKEEYSITAKGFIKQLTEIEQRGMIGVKKPTPPYVRVFVPQLEMLNLILKGFKEIKMIEDRQREDAKEAGEENRFNIWSQDFNKEAEMGMLQMKHHNPKAYDYFFVNIAPQPAFKLERNFTIMSRINLKGASPQKGLVRAQQKPKSPSSSDDDESVVSYHSNSSAKLKRKK